ATAARDLPRRAGTAVVVHRDPGTPVEHARHRPPGEAADRRRSVPCPRPPELCRRRRGGTGSPAPRRRDAHGRRLLPRQRPAAATPDPGGGSGTGAARARVVTTDLLVVGGGPVGLVTALEGRRAGLEVTVIEPRPAPIDKACGQGIMPAGVGRLCELGVEPHGAELTGITYVCGDRRVTATFRQGT